MSKNPNLKSGLFVTFEGIDGSGKTLQGQRLAANLESREIPSVLLRDPGSTPVSEAIRSILLDVGHQSMHEVTELLLYEAARAQLVEESIVPALSAGNVVICDRFIDSTTAYQGYGREIPLDLIERANELGSRGLIPDRTFLLDIDWETSRKRLLVDGREPDRLEGEAHHFFERIRSGYQQIAVSSRERVRLLDGTDDPDQLEQIVFQEVYNLMRSKEKG